ncbi:uncharacterized protein LOC120266816 isoform X1 [Dioscorea cayenensis subsp. rotundata]|uniref:Uncharacterized protein LOC120266816 isoform X1 n=1 Tax=Dioscorea cayennensis subsp. rotundata TaxID=55577 RepID=A0AB40BUR5_DIOCR|nr:uncharacterized protein LOC120266816 isoform X1 [Dioscorea cayenensis subsp. rotundata]XP_039130407.1 uncharacterized protein LOC120266816 isoform X1 [Dioscorea cayenensis subsp. rotundata]
MASWLKLSLVCLSIVTLDVGAGILAIKAEKAQSQEANPCEAKSKTLAYKLGLGAAILMLVAFIITDTFTNRHRFRQQSEPARKPASMRVASVTYVLAWAIFILGIALMGAAASTGDPKRRLPCSFSKHHLLAIGGVLCFIEAVVCVTYHLAANTGDKNS